jgi:hypothetical protein
MWPAALRSDEMEAATDPPKWKWSSALLGVALSGMAHRAGTPSASTSA